VIVLDTNVLSEIMAPRGAPDVHAWINRLRRSDLFTTTITQAEVLFGIAIMPKSRKQRDLIGISSEMFGQDFRGRVLPFDGIAAAHYADIVATRRRKGQPIQPLDAQIAAIARSRGMALATRDVKDFEECEIELINPWAL
jgi:predicted nucleic acid-binding protein